VVRNHKLARISAQSEILFLTFVESCHDGEGEEESERERERERGREGGAERGRRPAECESAVERGLGSHNYAPIVGLSSPSRVKRDPMLAASPGRRF